MTQGRWRRVSWVLVGAALIASCTDPGPPVFPTASQLPVDERRPDAVAVDLPSQPPPPQGEASTADAVVTLRSPLGLDNSSEGATLYITDSPCMECAKLIIQAGISRVVYSNKYRVTEGLNLLERAGVAVEQLEFK